MSHCVADKKRMNSTTTALAVIIEDNATVAKINRIRAGCDKAFPRWMPHINLAFPFVSEKEAAAKLLAVQKSLANVEPFELQLDQVHHFTQKECATIHVAPSLGGDALSAVQQQALMHFPPPALQRPFMPHLTLGQFPLPTASAASCVLPNCTSTEAMEQAIVHELGLNTRPIIFHVKELVVLARPTNKHIAEGATDEFKVLYRIPLNQMPSIDSVSRNLLQERSLQTKDQIYRATLMQAIDLTSQWMKRMILTNGGVKRLPTTLSNFCKTIATFANQKVKLDLGPIISILQKQSVLTPSTMKKKVPAPAQQAAGRGRGGGRARGRGRSAPSRPTMVTVQCYNVNPNATLIVSNSRHPPSSTSVVFGNTDAFFQRLGFTLSRIIGKGRKQWEQPALQRQLEDLCQVRVSVEPLTVAQELIKRGSISCDDNGRMSYK